ncbi:MAG: ThiF family adenylyltransferase [Armatimonadetes bacterium]|nr:ThiF family adenylyltransferase [Armatimonadota bacterium]
MLSALDHERYARQIMLPEVGQAGQQAWRDASVAVVGLGGVGGPCALYLAAAGVGRLALIDHDRVAPADLPRQILFGPADLGLLKTERAATRLTQANPEVEVRGLSIALTADNAELVLAEYDAVVAAGDSYALRYVVNDACVRLGRPWIDGSVYQGEGQVAVYAPALGGPCYRCRFPAPPAEVATQGVLGPLAGQVGCCCAAETLKLLLPQHPRVAPLLGRVMLFDTMAGDAFALNVPKDPWCPCCAGL